jgi:hypothetical protein
MKHGWILALLAGALSGAGAARAQTTSADTTDVQGRAGVSWNLDLPKRWEMGLEYELRMVDNLSSYRGSYFTVHADYGLTKHLSGIVSYRRAALDDGTSNRYAAGMEYERKLGSWRVGFRPLLQYRTEGEGITTVQDDDEASGNGDTFLRTRLRLERPVTKKLDLYASVEPLFVFGEDYPIDNWRNKFGLQYEYSQNKAVDLYYVLRFDYGKSYNRVLHTVGVSFCFTTKVRGK